MKMRCKKFMNYRISKDSEGQTLQRINKITSNTFSGNKGYKVEYISYATVSRLTEEDRKNITMTKKY